MPGLDSVIRIANALDITVDRLCYGDGASSLINEPVDEGRKIVNCVEYLIRAGILKKIHPFSSEMNEKHKISIEGHTIELSRFYDAVMDFQEKKHTYPDPESYYEQTMTSAANEINEKINKTKWLKNRPDPAVGNY